MPFSIGWRVHCTLLLAVLLAFPAYLLFRDNHKSMVYLKLSSDNLNEVEFDHQTVDSQEVDSPARDSRPEVAAGSQCFSTNSNNALSIHMVIVPFLGYNGSEEAILEREKDYIYVLQKNLAHPLVQCVHLLTTTYNETLERFKGVSNRSKMLISEVKSVNIARGPWEYISQNLLGKDVMFSNADIYLGGGFDLVDPVAMDQQKIMYSLSRQVAREDKIKCGKTSKKYFFKDLCTEKYMGAHDVFLFRLHQPLLEIFFNKLDFDLVRFGMENRVMWLFQKVLKYCVLNPCTILETFHYHCSDLRTNLNKPSLEREKRLRVLPSRMLLCQNSTLERKGNS